MALPRVLVSCHVTVFRGTKALLSVESAQRLNDKNITVLTELKGLSGQNTLSEVLDRGTLRKYLGPYLMPLNT